MKLRRIAATLALLLPACVASAEFEGEADFKITTRREKKEPLLGNARMYVSPSGFRMEWTMKTGSSSAKAPQEIKMTMLASLPNPDKVYLINDENKTYSVWDTKQAREDMKTAPKESDKVEKLGTDKVAGYPCQNARVTSSKGNDFEVCVTKEFGPSTDWIAAMNRNDPETRSWLKALKDQGIEGFPIRWAVRQKGSEEPMTVMELVRAQKKSLSASLFSVPAGYKETGFAVGGLTPEQEEAMSEALKRMSPEQRRQYEEMMKRHGQPTPVP
jgi:Domain of unknown function (DUF4412)